MWKTATIMSAIGVILSLVGTEYFRAVIDRKRTRTRGMGGTQDVLLIGMVIGWGFIVMTLGSGIMWWMSVR